MIRSAAPSGRNRRADEQEKTHSNESGNEQCDNVFDRKVRKNPITLKEAGRILTEIGLFGAANKIMKTISESIETNDKKIETPAESLNAGGKNKNLTDS